jgi:hypothetical protein
MPSQQAFNFASFTTRLVFAIILVLATYNPSGYSFIGWLTNGGDTPMVYKAILGVILLIGWVVYLRATINSLGTIGISLATVFMVCLVWLLIEWKLFNPENVSAMTWVIEMVIACVLAIGMSWSHIRRRMSGQYDTDEIES